ncbi:MAG: methylmalonyl Co-A mutase-associated GTPase MeaB [bacterium]|nr:MAG: methylmalonyl Co-A mutase-associated GTPase MeaB [bacterium]
MLALGRLARIIDDGEDGAGEIIRSIYRRAGRAHVVGITGPPGAGKSTLVNGLVRRCRKEGRKVAVLAVDPTSPYSGGAVLGDRIRMQEHATDPGVFIRSLATRGHMGGLSRSAMPLTILLDAVGHDLIFLETVGVGQEEVEVKDLAHTKVFVTVPGLGDGIQAMKAGVLEIADILLVNKADLPRADLTVRDLETMVKMAEGDRGWTPPVLTSVASEDVGLAEVMSSLTDHYRFLLDSDFLHAWSLSTAEAAVREAMRGAAEAGIMDLLERERAAFAEDVGKVSLREEDPITVARRWLAKLGLRDD